MIVRFSALLLGVGMLAACGGERDALNSGGSQTNAVTHVATVNAAQGAYTVVLEWLSGFPRAGDKASARLTFATADGQIPAEVEVQQVRFYMPAHSHGTQHPTISRVDGAPLNEVTVSGMDILMSGEWQMEIDAAVNGVVDTAVLLIDVQ